jgi:hypothetical protein
MDKVRKPSNSDTYLVCPIIDKEDTMMGIINMVMENAAILPKGVASFPRGEEQRLFLSTALDSRAQTIKERGKFFKCVQIY